MNKLIIREVGYDFSKENIDYIKRLTPLDRLGLFYILPNYTQLQKNRKNLAKALGGISINNIMTFDDLADMFSDNRTYINREEAAWIIKKIIENMEEKQFSNSIGSSREILSFILELKSHNIYSNKFKNELSKHKFNELNGINRIYEKYEEFLKEHNLEDSIGKYLNPKEKTLNKNIKNSIIINGFIEFRAHELYMIKHLINLGYSVIIQLPFLTSKSNRKLNKTINDLKKLGFIIEQNIDENKINIGYDIFSENQSIHNIDHKIISSTSKYYEIREVFGIIKEELNNYNIEDISIIINDEYENMIRSVAKEESVPINIMNEEKASNLPLISSVINFLELIKDDEKKKLISYLLDNNFNIKYIKNIELILNTIRSLDYKGIDKKYDIDSKEVSEFLEDVKLHFEDFKINPIEKLENLFSEEKVRENAISSFENHLDRGILSDSLKSIEILDNIVTRVIKFGKLINLNWKDLLEILINTLKDEKYYSDNINGVKVLKGINALGTYSEIRFIVGLNNDFPSVQSQGYLYREKFKHIYKNLELNFQDKFEAFDNELLIYSGILSTSGKLNFSYLYSDPNLSDSMSILLKDTLKRLNNELRSEIKSSTIVKSKINKYDSDTNRFIFDFYNSKTKDTNYLSYEKVNMLNNLNSKYNKRESSNEIFWGKVESYQDNLHSQYSPKMLEFYNTCPFKFYIHYILKYKVEELEFIDEYHLNKGNFYHKVLELFFKDSNYLNLSSLEIEELVRKSMENASLELQINGFNQFEKKLLLNTIYQYVNTDIVRQKKYTSKFIPTYFEKSFSNTFSHINISGRIDRVDVDKDNNLIVTDYKSKNSPTKGEVANLKELQLPIYGLLVGKDSVVALTYGVIEKNEVQNTIFHEDLIKSTREGGKMSPEELKNYFNVVENKILEIDNLIKSGYFIVNPISDSVCKYCDFNNICRKEDLS